MTPTRLQTPPTPAALGALVCTLLLVGCNDAARNAALEVTGVVEAQVVPGEVSIIGLTTDTASYVLFYDSTTALVGIEEQATGVVWDLGKWYRVLGSTVVDSTEVSAARGRGYDGIIMATRVELLDSLSP